MCHKEIPVFGHYKETMLRIMHVVISYPNISISWIFLYNLHVRIGRLLCCKHSINFRHCQANSCIHFRPRTKQQPRRKDKDEFRMFLSENCCGSILIKLFSFFFFNFFVLFLFCTIIKEIVVDRPWLKSHADDSSQRTLRRQCKMNRMPIPIAIGIRWQRIEAMNYRRRSSKPHLPCDTIYPSSHQTQHHPFLKNHRSHQPSSQKD